MDKTPKLSVGLPVFNGEKRNLDRAIRSILDQSFSDFELLIGDNDSTDNTPEICRAFAEADPRVSYYRNRDNLGASENSFRLLAIARGEYFVWAADDDWRDPQYFQKCVSRLDADAEAVTCYSRFSTINEEGQKTEVGDSFEALQGTPLERFSHTIEKLQYCTLLYGIHRTHILRRIRRVSEEARGTDVIGAVELALQGKILQVPEVLFEQKLDTKWRLELEERYAHLYDYSGPFMTDRGITFPTCRLAHEILKTIKLTPVLNRTQKSDLFLQARDALAERWANTMHFEILRGISLVVQRKIFCNWDEDPAQSEASFDPKFNGLNSFHAHELLVRLEEAWYVSPDFGEPGLHYARAVCLTILNRFGEADLAVEMELQENPQFEPAVKLKKILQGMKTP